MTPFITLFFTIKSVKEPKTKVLSLNLITDFLTMVRAPNSFSTVGNVNFNFFQSDDQSTSNAIFSALAYATIAEIH